MTATDLKAIVDKNQAWLRGEADGERADLSGANLRSANLRSANLSGADLSGADLGSADLSGANLSGANLRSANLRSANLSGADLRSADLSGAWMPNGETWERYCKEVVPALLVAGGRPLSAIIESKAWQCHDWSNCPMHVAFGIHCDDDGPLLLVPRIREFVQLFDAGLIPEPTLPTPTAEPVAA